MNEDKRPWREPELIVLVRGRNEETVLAACKLSGGTMGPAAGNCAKPNPGCLILAVS